jgi:hypothetical protein
MFKLEVLELSSNTGLTGKAMDVHLPPNLKHLGLAYTSLNGSLPTAWAAQAQSLDCIVVIGTANLCGPTPDGLPCMFQSGTGLGETQPESAVPVSDVQCLLLVCVAYSLLIFS